MKMLVKSILLVCITSTFIACNTRSEKTKDKDLIVNIATAELQVIDSKKEFSFISKPYRTSQLSFRVGGPIDNFNVYVGNYYKRGDVIAEIDARDFSIKKEKTEAVYNQAKAEYNRLEILYNKKNISASAYEKAKAECTAANMSFQTAVNELSDTKLIAPFNGYIGEIYIEKHQDVKPSQVVVSLVEIDQIKIEVYVTQDIAFNSDNIKTIDVQFDAIPNNKYEAKVVEVSKSTTKNNLSYLLTALLPNADGKLLSGMSGKVSFASTYSSFDSVITIPQSALCHRPIEGDYVWILNEDINNVTRRKVSLGELQKDGKVSILEGVNNGEVVVVSGLRFLSEGMNVITNPKTTI